MVYLAHILKYRKIIVQAYIINIKNGNDSKVKKAQIRCMQPFSFEAQNTIMYVIPFVVSETSVVIRFNYLQVVKSTSDRQTMRLNYLFEKTALCSKVSIFLHNVLN